ncbi:c-type cytochrome biogenesis protein CcmI [Maricaulis maris]|uniref:Cytochrome c-type biogenesis protein CcmH n=1 Tax=Maricaulis maris TaxID=74318 RepID=A0A495DJA8_9PROT|nr:c-type cytochrome biogenesis protein CcmI [Maricaulis maris]RKR02704.1 cytochrome c-type biogenesis protein CcmH [Maricaulis maris]
MIWFLIAALASLVALVLVLPVMRGVRGDVSDGRDVFDGQLAELARDRELGFIGEDAARQAELDIRRRMSQAGTGDAAALAPPAAASKWLRHGLVGGAGVSVILAVIIYMLVGSPFLVGMTPARAPGLPPEAQAVMAELENLRNELAERPDNPQGWAVLGQAYLRMGRYGDAATAFETAINWEPGSAFLFAALGQARLFETGGMMNAAAREAFARALDIDPLDVRARFFMAEAVYQDGDREAALASWQAILDSAAPDAAYRGMVEARIAAALADGEAAALSGDEVEP